MWFKIALIVLVIVAAEVVQNDAAYGRRHRASSVYFTAFKLRRTFLMYGKSRTGRPRDVTRLKKIDLLFLLDRSKNTGKTNLKHAIKFISTILDHFSITPSITRVALISYASTAKVEFKFKDHFNRDCIIKAISKIKYTRGKAATGKALQAAMKLLKDPTSGTRKKAKRLIFIIAAGESKIGIRPAPIAEKLKTKPLNARIFTLGIGAEDNEDFEEEVEDMVSSWRYLYKLGDFSDLRRLGYYLRPRSYKSCRGCGIRYDECGRRCQCKNGRLVNCCRVRKDFTSMTYKERERYVKTVKKVSTVQPFKAKYEKMITIHRTYFEDRIHTKDEFLPWHRWYIWELENLLREADCRVTVPYWDWSLWSHNPWSSKLPSLWHASSKGLGGNGNGTGFCVQTGPFRQGVWNITTAACLARNFNGIVPDAVQVQNAINQPTFSAFELFLRVNLHDLVHCLIDGTMCTIDSANAPEFFMHHGFIDKIWYDYQKKSITNKNAFFPNITLRLRTTPYYPRHFIDFAKQPKCVRVCYDEPTVHKGKKVKKFLRGLSKTQLTKLQRMPFSKLNERVLDRFNVSPAERKMAYELEKQSWTGIGKAKSRRKSMKLKGLDRVLGFKIRP